MDLTSKGTYGPLRNLNLKVSLYLSKEVVTRNLVNDTSDLELYLKCRNSGEETYAKGDLIKLLY